MSTQLTIRNVPDELALRLKALARARGTSVNSLVLDSLREVAGIDERRARLQRYVDWSQEDGEALARAVRAQRVVEEEIWK